MKRTDLAAQMIGHRVQPLVTPYSLESPNPLLEDASSFPSYRIDALLGAGIGRRTYLATETHSQQPVILMLLLFGPDFPEVCQQQWLLEVQKLTRLNHPAIARYLSAFEVSTPLGHGFALVRAYLKGQSLRELVASGRYFTEAELCLLAKELLSALDYVHSEPLGLLHRDIRPSNLLLVENGLAEPGTVATIQAGTVRLVGFGALPPVEQGGSLAVVGSGVYSAPELFFGQPQPASDLYSVGRTLIYLAIGEYPGQPAALNQRLNACPGLSRGFKQWLWDLGTPDLDQRIPSAAEALQQLDLHRLPKAPLTAAECNYATPLVALTPRPRMSRADMQVSCVPQELDIHFSSSRIREGLPSVSAIAKGKHSSALASVGDPIGEYGPMLLAAMTTIVCVGGAVAYTGSIWMAMLVAALLPGLFWFVAPLFEPLGARKLLQSPERRPDASQAAQVTSCRQAARPCVSAHRATLKFRNGLDNRVTVSLMTTPPRADNRKAHLGFAPTARTVHFSRLPLESIAAKPTLFGRQVTFTLLDSHRNVRRRLRVVGTHQEIKWLCAHLVHWGELSAQQRLLEKQPLETSLPHPD